MRTKELDRSVFVFNPGDNGGESLSLITTVNGHPGHDEEKFLTQELQLMSYVRSTTIQLVYDLRPDNLRKLADQLEKFEKLLNIKR